ncbi:MAG: hypothetical protein EOM05_11210 [Clostridia bacterium]|nr:hypothetical protein [Clostridia bacterium]
MKLGKIQLAGFIFTVVVGTALHFIYEWSGENVVAAVFGAVNESVWEHLKLIIVPMLIFGIIEYFLYGRKLKNFVQVRFLSILLGMAIIVIGHYTYSGIIGKNYFIVDILLFLSAVCAAYSFSYKTLRTEKFSTSLSKELAIFGILFLIVCVIIFTFVPPQIQLFLDPSTGSYGIPAK